MAYKRPSPIPVPEGGTGDQSVTAYSVVCGGTTNTAALQTVSGVGSTGQVLTSQGASNLPIWSNAAGSGALVLLNTVYPSSSASVVFNSTYITGTYSSYFVLFEGITPSSGTPGIFTMNISTNNGSGYLNSGFTSGVIYNTYNSATIGVTSSTTSCPLTFSQVSTAILNGYMYLNLPQSGTAKPSYNGQLFTSGAGAVNMSNYGLNSGTTAINNIQFLYSGVTIASGSISLYGIAQ